VICYRGSVQPHIPDDIATSAGSAWNGDSWGLAVRAWLLDPFAVITGFEPDEQLLELPLDW
jgi:hypothetical protein